MAITTAEEYEGFMQQVEALMNLDPDPETPEGQELLRLVTELQEYEKQFLIEGDTQ